VQYGEEEFFSVRRVRFSRFLLRGLGYNNFEDDLAGNNSAISKAGHLLRNSSFLFLRVFCSERAENAG